MENQKKQPVIVVAGPTASGKTSLGIQLAKLYDGEVISADSMQIYKGLDITTAKPTKEEMCGVPHHLISVINQEDSFSVADYVKLAREKISEISSRNKLPIIVGGTGLYISSLIDNISFDNVITDDSVRQKLIEESKRIGNEAMLEKLRQIDPETAEALHPNNITRIIRAIEVYEVSGIKFSENKVLSRIEESPYSACMIGLSFEDRQKLYDRINMRVDIMMKNGMLEETREVYDSKHLKTAHQAIGYKELVPYFEGCTTLEECIDKIKQESRRYAKRQLTWFRRDKRINWILLDRFNKNEEINAECKKIVAKSEIICYNENNSFFNNLNGKD